MATLLSKFEKLDYDSKKGGVPVEQIYLDLTTNTGVSTICLGECFYVSENLRKTKIESFDSFLKAFKKGTVYFAGKSLPSMNAYDSNELKFYFMAPSSAENFDALKVYASPVDRPSNRTKLQPKTLPYGNKRKYDMSKIDADFAKTMLPGGTVVSDASVRGLKRSIPTEDKYFLAVLNGGQNPQYIKESEVYVQLTDDGDTWSDIKVLDISSIGTAEFYKKLKNGQVRLLYHGQYINSIDADNNRMAEYVVGSVTSEEIIDYKNNEIVEIDPNKNQTDKDYYISRRKIDSSYSVFEPGTREIADEEHPGATKEESIYNVTTYLLNNTDGEFIKLILTGQVNPEIFRLNQLYVKINGGFEQIHLNQGDVHDVLTRYVGQRIFVDKNGEKQETEPLTVENTLTFGELKTFQKSQEEMSDDSYLLLKSGEYIKESSVQPISYIFNNSDSGSQVDAYLVERGDAKFIITKELYEQSKTAPVIKIQNGDGDEISIDVDAGTKFTELTRSVDLHFADVVQTTSNEQAIESAVVLDRNDSEQYKTQVEDIRQGFLNAYKSNNYKIDSVYTESNDWQDVDRTKGDRFVYQANRTIPSYAENTAEYKGLVTEPITFQLKNGEITKIGGGPKFNVAKANKEAFKAYRDVLKTIGALSISPIGILSALAFPVVVGAVAVSAVATPIMIPAINSIRAINKSRSNNKFTDKFLIEREKIKENSLNELKDLYTRSVEIEKENKNIPISRYMNEYQHIYADIVSLGQATNNVEIKISNAGSIVCTSDNAHLLSLFKTRYNNKLASIDNLTNARVVLKEELQSLKLQAEKYAKRKLDNEIPQSLQEEIERYTELLAKKDQEFVTAKQELENKYMALSQEVYAPDKEQAKMLKVAECFKLMSIVRLSSKQTLMDLGFSAEEITVLKACKFNSKNLTIKYNGKFNLIELLDGKAKRKQANKDSTQFNYLSEILNRLKNIDEIRSNAASEAKVFNGDEVGDDNEARADFEIELERYKTELASLTVEQDRVRVAYYELQKLHTLESQAKKIDPNTNDVKELEVLKQISELRSKYKIGAGKQSSADTSNLEKELDESKLNKAKLIESRDELIKQEENLTAEKDLLIYQNKIKQEEKENYAIIHLKQVDYSAAILGIDDILRKDPDGDEAKELQKQRRANLNKHNILENIAIIVQNVYDNINRLNNELLQRQSRITELESELKQESGIAGVLISAKQKELDELKRSQPNLLAERDRADGLVHTIMSVVEPDDFKSLKEIAKANGAELGKGKYELLTRLNDTSSSDDGLQRIAEIDKSVARIDDLISGADARIATLDQVIEDKTNAINEIRTKGNEGDDSTTEQRLAGVKVELGHVRQDAKVLKKKFSVVQSKYGILTNKGKHGKIDALLEDKGQEISSGISKLLKNSSGLIREYDKNFGQEKGEAKGAET